MVSCCKDPPSNDARYALAPGTQVREEEFGLLFYTMSGPRLYFLSCGSMLDPSFFQGRYTVKEWLNMKHGNRPAPGDAGASITKALQGLKEKGVILER